MTRYTENQPAPATSTSRKRVLLVAPRTAQHHLAGVRQSLRQHGHTVSSETLQHTSRVRVLDRQLDAHDLLVHTDSHSVHAWELTRRARQHGVFSGLIMDGVLEFANTFLNPAVGADFLSPAPADVIFTLGSHDQRILESLGNRAVPTGLPRIDIFRDQLSRIITESSHQSLLIATANQPWFDNDARERLLEVLAEIQQAASQRNLPVHWRVGSQVAESLGVVRDTRPLAISLAQASAVMTSASTLALEAMLANKPTALIHPHPWPLWIPTSIIYRGDSTRLKQTQLSPQMGKADDAATASIHMALNQRQAHDTHSIHHALDQLLGTNTDLLETQHEILKHCISSDAPDAIATWVTERPPTPKLHAAHSPQSPAHAPETGRLHQELLTLRRDGAQRIALLTNTTPTPELEALCDQHADQFVGFVIPESTEDSFFLACPASSLEDASSTLRPDALLVTSADAIAPILFGVLQRCPIELKRIRCPDDPELPSIVRHAIELIRDASAHGEVRTTLPADLSDTLVSVPTNHAFSGERPAMLLLAGDENDFAIYAQSRAWREQGTVVCSIRWHEDELSSPERFRMMIQARPQQAFALYGAGRHTERLMRYAALDQAPSLIIDDDAKPGQQLAGRPVVLPSDPAIGDIELIVLSSRAHETQLWAKSEPFRRVGIETIPLYATAALSHDRLC